MMKNQCKFLIDVILRTSIEIEVHYPCAEQLATLQSLRPEGILLSLLPGGACYFSPLLSLAKVYVVTVLQSRSRQFSSLMFIEVSFLTKNDNR